MERRDGGNKISRREKERKRDQVEMKNIKSAEGKSTVDLAK